LVESELAARGLRHEALELAVRADEMRECTFIPRFVTPKRWKPTERTEKSPVEREEVDYVELEKELRRKRAQDRKRWESKRNGEFRLPWQSEFARQRTQRAAAAAAGAKCGSNSQLAC
jgi:hypothetical protein